MKIGVKDGVVAAQNRIEGARVTVYKWPDGVWGFKFRRVMKKGEKPPAVLYGDKRGRLLEARISVSKEAMLAVQDCVLTIMEMEGKGAKVKGGG